MAKNNMGLKTKNKILDAAHSLFNIKTIESTSVEEIAEKAGITKAMVYYHFESKESIVLELVGKLLDAVSHELSANLSVSISREDMIKIVGKVMNLWKENRELALFIISKGIRDENLFSRIIKIASPFFGMLVASKNRNDISQNVKTVDSDKLFKIVLFNAMPMLLSTVIIDKYKSEFHLTEQKLQESFQEQFVEVLFSILGDNSEV